MRCAIYARYSSDLQRDSSVEDQIRKCREFAERSGWSVVEDFVCADRAISAAAVAGRVEFNALIVAAKKRPSPFDRILVDDSSRLARNLTDALKAVEVLTFHGVGVSFISQSIDSLSKSARPLLMLHGLVEEQYLEGLRDKVHRGQEGRVLHGLTPGVLWLRERARRGHYQTRQVWQTSRYGC